VRGEGVVDPEISVVIPTFNRARYLGESIDSVLGQEGPPFEVIVVDDGSTDDTAALLARYGGAVRVLRQDNGGIAAARNTGVAAARGRFIAFHDSDDLALAGRIARPHAVLGMHPECDIAIGNGIFLAPEGTTGSPRPWLRPEVARSLDGREVTFREIFRWNLGQLQATLISRASLEAVGPLRGEFLILDDLDVMLRLALRYRARFVDEPFFAYRQHGTGVTQNRMLLRQESIRLAERLVSEHPEILDHVGTIAYTRRQARRYARLATLKMAAGDMGGARTAIAEACRLAPRNVGYRLQALAIALRRH
jgi:glycosyltransferase involved in cell wall biosynthesis